MFDKQNYKNIQEKLNRYEEKIKVLEELKQDMMNLYYNIQDNCSHDLVLCYAPESYPLDKRSSNIKKAHCLVCDSYLELDGTFEMYSEEEINKKNIIDITNIINEDFQRTSRGGVSILVLRAKETLNKIMDREKNFTLFEIKKMIIEDLIEYEKYLTDKKSLKKVLKRDDENDET